MPSKVELQVSTIALSMTGHMTTTRRAATVEEEEMAMAATGAVNLAPLEADDREQQKKARARNKKKRRRAPSEEELAALRSVLLWARRGEAGDDDAADCGGHLLPAGRRRPRVAVELHAHSARSDGSLSPAALVERAHRNGVSLLSRLSPTAETFATKQLRHASIFLQA